MPSAGWTPEDYDNRVWSEAAKEWQVKRIKQRRNDVTVDTRMSYEPIVFPDAAGCRHAALVICAQARDAADAKVILEALALPTIMREGGDGRAVKVQRGPVTGAIAAKPDPKPLGYNPEDYGQVAERKKRKR